MRLLIDGYNLMFQSPAVQASLDRKGELRAARGRLLSILLDLIEESQRDRTLVVFDSKRAPEGLPDRYVHSGIQVFFARDWDSADEFIQEAIRKHPTPRLLTVVSSDHAIHRRALARGATVVDGDVWLDEQWERVQRREQASQQANETVVDLRQQPLDKNEQEKWLREFGF